MKYRRLNWQDRDQISVELAAGKSIRAIAAMMLRSPSSISREVKRLGHKYRQYHPLLSQSDANRKSRLRRHGQRKILLNLEILT